MNFLLQNQNFEIGPLGNILLFIVFLWSIAWKGLSLWNAAKYNQKNWFIALLILNTASIVEIIYLFKFAKNKFGLDTVTKFLLSLKKVSFSNK